MKEQNIISDEDIENVFDSYMKKIIRNTTAKEIQRQVKRYRFEQYLSEVDQVVEVTFEVDDSLNTLLSHLKETDKEIIILNICNQISLKEVAEILNLNYQTVRTKKMRALVRLKEWGKRDGLWKI